MLHILWILIKFILILLGILLGLALLAVLLLLFCPVRYQARAAKETDSFKEAEVEAKVTWLFHAIGARFFLQNGETKLVITLFGVSLETIKSWLGKLKGGRKKNSGGRAARSGAKRKKKPAQTRAASQKKSDVKKSAENPQIPKPQPEKVRQESTSAKPPVPKPVETVQSTPAELLVQKQDAASVPVEPRTQKPVETVQQESTTAEPPMEKTAEVVQQENVPAEPQKQKPVEIVQLENTAVEPPTVEESAPEQEENTEPVPKPGLFTRIREILSKIIRLPGNLWNKITSLIKDIIEKIRNIKKTIDKIKGKLDWWKAFLTNERTKAALSLVWKDAKGLIRHVLPTKVEGQVTFGCEDPSITGTALAVLGMTFPFHKNRIQVTPLFDGGNQLTGNVSLKGRIYGIMFIKAAIEIYFNKNIKYVINRWKHKED